MELAIFSEAQSSFTLRASEDAHPGYPSVKGYGLGVEHPPHSNRIHTFSIYGVLLRSYAWARSGNVFFRRVDTDCIQEKWKSTSRVIGAIE